MFSLFILFGLRVKELEHYITKELALIREKLQTDINVLISNRLPNISPILGEIKAQIEVLRQKVDKILMPEIQKLEQQEKDLDPSKVKLGVEQKIQELEDQKRPFAVDVSTNKLSYNWKLFPIIYSSVFVLTGIDAGTNYQSLQVLVDNEGIAILLSVCVAGGLAFGAHIFGTRIRTTKPYWQKIFWFSSAMIISSLVFYFLGQQRKIYMDTGSNLVFSPFLWMLFCDFFFLTAVLLIVFLWPSKEQEMENVEINRKKDVVAKINLDIKEAKDSIAKKETEYSKVKQELEKFKGYQSGLHNSLDKELELLIAIANKEFEMKRGLKKGGSE